MRGTARRRGARTAVAVVLVGIALYAVGSLGASIGSHDRASVAEYQYPDIEMDATPNTVSVGQPVEIDWTTTNVDTCTAFGEWSGPKPLNGSESHVVWGWENGFFALECSGIWGDIGDGVFVDVTSPVTPRAIVDQQQSYASDFTDERAGIAQTFTVGVGGWLSDVFLSGTGTNSFDRVAITRVTPSGAPDPTRVLWTSTVLNQATAGNLHLAKPILVTPGQRYALILTAPNGGDDYVFGLIGCDSPHPYVRGDMYVQDEPGGSWALQAGCDTIFKTLVVQRFRTGP